MNEPGRMIDKTYPAWVGGRTVTPASARIVYRVAMVNRERALRRGDLADLAPLTGLAVLCAGSLTLAEQRKAHKWVREHLDRF